MHLAMVDYLSNPKLPVIKKDFKGNVFLKGQFEMEEMPSKPHGFSTILKWQLGNGADNKIKKTKPYQVSSIQNNSFLTDKSDCLVWLGHSSFFMRLGGKTIITDPCLTDLPFIKRLVALPCEFDALQNIDYMLMSHGHRDHFDTACVRRIIDQNPEIKLLLPLKISELLGKYKSRTQFQEAGWYQQFDTVSSELEIFFLPAKHWNRRGFSDYNKTLWGSFWIRYKNLNIYFAGDTAYYKHFTEIREVMGEPDICLMPVGAYHPSFIMKEAHTTPEEAVQGFHDLGGKIFIPMHYGTYDLADEPLGEPVEILTQMQQQQQINGTLRFLTAGKEMIIG